MEPAQAFGRALRQRRRGVGLTQERLALDAGIERVYISLLETGNRQPTFQMMVKLAIALGCSAADIVADAELLLASDEGK
jgi:transcriptional regulator with XRE-family HTH domain